MTVFEAYGKLWDFFKDNDSFVMEEDFRKILLITETPTRDRAAIQSALDDWVTSKVLAREIQTCWNKELKDNEKKVIYILKKPMDSNEQSVSVNANMAGYITREINDFCELIEDKTDWSDPTDINQKDILNVLHILNFYKEKYRQEIGLSDGNDDNGKKK
jgi:hypothetical protein